MRYLIKYWFYITLILGLCLIFLVPPFQSPDEFRHLYRAYQISDGQIWGEIDSTKTKLGGNIPQSLVTVSTPFSNLVFHTEIKTSVKTILENIKIPLEKNKTVFISFPNTARYAVTAYISQVLSISVLKLFNTPPLWIMYIGRIATFLLWLFIIRFALRESEKLKELIVLLILIPASLAINCTLNADVITNGLLFLFFVLIFKYKFSDQKISNKYLWIITLIILITSINKVVYFPLLVLLLIIKKENFGSLGKKIGFITSWTLLSIVLIFILNNKVHNLVYPYANDQIHTTYGDLREGYNVNPDLQIKCIKSNPKVFITNLYTQSIKALETSRNTWIGGFGWESSMPDILENGYWHFLIIFSLFYNVNFQLWERILFLLGGFGCTMLFLISTHLHWDGVGDYIEIG